MTKLPVTPVNKKNASLQNRSCSSTLQTLLGFGWLGRVGLADAGIATGAGLTLGWGKDYHIMAQAYAVTDIQSQIQNCENLAIIGKTRLS
ncbi:hypothetical protein PoB_002619900 [Plakobranchus ocellatus]|uniref:Uncharacterized protein n=1 Tax=Plakobranchus ocellatus TaxID=259542 RepID=A0AAV3ZZ90_9GAST|nr:hypothetical protein PoB_002619900 [Plakobranchus ocellatus]